MAETLPTPRATPEAQDKVVADAAENSLEAALDELLKRYLLLLDEYTQARQQLATELSSGFLSLAQANFNPSNRIRYGQDFYDQRMQALRCVTVEEKDCKLRRSIHLLDPPKEKPKEAATATDNSKKERAGKDTSDDVSSSVAQLSLDEGVKDKISPGEDSSGSAASDSLGKENKENVEKTQTKDEGPSQKPRADDPIRWFGIFVPPALRVAQTRFTNAVEGPVPKLVDLGSDLRELEAEIGRARKAIRKSAAT